MAQAGSVTATHTTFATALDNAEMKLHSKIYFENKVALAKLQ